MGDLVRAVWAKGELWVEGQWKPEPVIVRKKAVALS